jgi:hypothetical protein
MTVTLSVLYLKGRFTPEPLWYYVKAKVAGRDTTNCLSLPEHVWRLMEKCGGGERNNYGFPPSELDGK